MSKKCPEKPKNGFPELDSDMKYSLNSARYPLPHIQEKQKHFWHSCADDRYQVNKIFKNTHTNFKTRNPH